VLRAQMLDLRSSDQLGLAYIPDQPRHGRIRYMCDRVAVMFLGAVGTAHRPGRRATRTTIEALLRDPTPTRAPAHPRRFRYTGS
jgi:hypothetical protein